MNPQNTTYELPKQYAGMSLEQIGQAEQAAGRGIPRIDVLANILGVAHNQPLESGKYFTLGQLPQEYRNSGEGQFLTRVFQPGPSPEMRAIQPAVQSLEASIPEIQQRFTTERGRLEGEKQPLKERYQMLLDELKSREGRMVSTAQTATAREYGKRGIPLSSGVYDQALQGAVNPIMMDFANQFKDVSYQQESSLRDINNLITSLAGQETESTRDVRNALAQLQSQAGFQGIDNFYRQQAMDEEKRQFNVTSELQKQQQRAQELAQDLSRRHQETELNFQQQRQPLELQLLASQIARQNQLSSGGSSPKPSQLKFETVNDALGRPSEIVGYDPYTGEIKSRQTIQQQFGGNTQAQAPQSTNLDWNQVLQVFNKFNPFNK